jgi:hypothetical protein
LFCLGRGVDGGGGMGMAMMTLIILTSWKRVLLEKASFAWKFPAFSEAEGSLTCVQEPDRLSSDGTHKYLYNKELPI